MNKRIRTQPEVQDIYRELAEKHGLTPEDIHKVHQHTWNCIRYCMSNVCGKILIPGLGAFKPWKKRIEDRLKYLATIRRWTPQRRDEVRRPMEILFFSRRHTLFFYNVDNPHIRRKVYAKQNGGRLPPELEEKKKSIQAEKEARTHRGARHRGGPINKFDRYGRKKDAR